MAFKLTYTDGQESDYDDGTKWEVDGGVLKLGREDGEWTSSSPRGTGPRSRSPRPKETTKEKKRRQRRRSDDKDDKDDKDEKDDD